MKTINDIAESPVLFATLLVICCVLPYACTEPFVPEVKDFKSVLVIDGSISDLQEPYLVKLSTTMPIDSSGSIPETDAMVSVFNSEGRRFSFAEGSPGDYWSNPAEFRANVGEKYQLDIVRKDGRHYQSAEVLVKPVPAIDSVYFKRETRLTDVAGDTLHGIRILVDAHDPSGQTRYFRYDWVETYEIRPRYPSYYRWDFESASIVARDTLLNLCYNGSPSTNLLIASTTHLQEARVSQFEVNYVSTEGYRLKSLYSILVRQYALDEAGFRYWSELEKISETQGTVFDPYPYEIVGNVKNVDDPDEPVLGYFDASAVSEKRLYVSGEELRGLYYPRDPCINALITPRPNTQDFFLFISWGYMFVDAVGGLWGPPNCTDCRRHGTLQKPDFWPR